MSRALNDLHATLAVEPRQLGGHRMRRFTGGYDLLESLIYTEGDVLFDSVYRFKGR